MANIDWDNSDRVALRTFLLNNPKFLSYLQSRILPIDGKTHEEVSITASEHKGGEKLIEEIENAAEIVTEEPAPGWIDTDKSER